MITLRDVLALPGLGLSTVGEPTGLDNEVRWAHVTELADPTPWLLGEEFILTTGLNIDPSHEAGVEYCSRLVNAGVTALGVSTGATLPHPELPPGLVEGAHKAGLALVHVPEKTLLQSVVQKVSDALHEERNTPLLKSLTTQRELSEAAAGKDGISGVIHRLEKTSGFRSVIYDDRLRTIARTDPETEQRLAPLKDELRARLLKGLRWSMSTGDSIESVVALPLGTEGRLRGILVVSRPGVVTTYDRAALAMVVSLLSVLLELRHSLSSHQRSLYMRALDALLSPTVSAVEAAARLGESGITANSFRVMILAHSTPHDQVTALVAGLAELTSEVLVHYGKKEIALVLCDPANDLTTEVGRMVKKTECGPAGLGDPTDMEGVRSSLKQARFAQATAASRNMPLLARSEVGGYRALLMMGSAAERRAFADSILGELDDNDIGGKQNLFETLSTFVSCGGNIENAAEKLGVHRHTIRSRLQKISQLTQRDISHPPDLFELWLAVEFREAPGARSEP